MARRPPVAEDRRHHPPVTAGGEGLWRLSRRRFSLDFARSSSLTKFRDPFRFLLTPEKHLSPLGVLFIDRTRVSCALRAWDGHSVVNLGEEVFCLVVLEFEEFAFDMLAWG